MFNFFKGKEKGNVLYADTLVDFFGVDAVRYFVLHEMPFENDGVISWELMVERLNSDLANTLGNLVNRTISMSNKYFGGVVADKGAAEAVDEDLKAVVTGTSIRLRQRWKAGESQTRSPIFLRCSSAATNISTRQNRGCWQKTLQKQTVLLPYCIT